MNVIALNHFLAAKFFFFPLINVTGDPNMEMKSELVWLNQIESLGLHLCIVLFTLLSGLCSKSKPSGIWAFKVVKK